MQIFYVITFLLFAFAIISAIIIMKITYNSEVKLKKVSKKISDGYVILNKSGKITNFNETFLKFFNLKEKDVKRKNIKNSLSKSNLKKEDIAKIIEKLEKIEEEKKSEITVEEKNKIFKIEIMNLIDNDIFMRYVILVKDISNSYKMVEDLKANQEMIASRERFATLRWISNRSNYFFKISNFCDNRRVRRTY